MKLFKKKSKTKVLLGMSGGVDSSVAALLLKKQGYDVYGAFMKNWSDTKNKITGQCAWVEEREHAIKIATKLDIPFVTLDFEKEYKTRFSSYLKVITKMEYENIDKEFGFILESSSFIYNFYKYLFHHLIIS